MMINKILHRYPAVSLFIFSFLFMLPSYNKYWAPFDEGNYLTTARLTMQGLIPYRDFFFTMYPPGQAYTLAALLKIFGMNLIVCRIYNIILLSVICGCVFLITRKFASRKISIISFAICLITMASLGEPPIPRAVWPGVAFSLIAMIFFLEFLYKDSVRHLLLSSLFLGVTVIYRHDIGFITFAAGAIGIFIYYGYKVKAALKHLIIFASFPLLFIAGIAVWLHSSGAAGDALDAMFILPTTFSKWAAIPMPPFCCNFSMIFHRGCFFIRQNMFYIPVITCIAGSILYISGAVSGKKMGKKEISFVVILSFAAFYLQQLVFRADENHLAVSFPPSAILFGMILAYDAGYKSKISRSIKNLIVFYLCLLMALFAYYGAVKYIKDIYVKPFVKKSVEPVKFKQGTIYIPDDVRDTFVALIEYVEFNTKPGEKIYIGHLKHNIPQWGWFDLIYFLSERDPAVRYYILTPGFQTRVDIQEDMIESLKLNNARVLLLRDFGEAEELGELDKYIRSEYRLDKVIDSYHIYVKK